MKRFVKSLGHAFDGIRSALKTERNLRIHLLLSLVAVAIGIYTGITAVTWSLVIFAIGFVIASELFNTAVERLGDEAADGKENQTVKAAKDVAAAGVLVSALTAFVMGLLILIVPFINKLIDLS